MHGKILVIFALSAMGVIVVFDRYSANAQETLKRFAADKGPGTIDVSKYPKEMQDRYKNLFSPKCSHCHTLARPINTDYAPSKWQVYIKKMMLKKNVNGKDPNISGSEGKKIWEFLVFDTKTRKPKFWEKLAESEKALAEK